MWVVNGSSKCHRIWKFKFVVVFNGFNSSRIDGSQTHALWLNINAQGFYMKRRRPQSTMFDTKMQRNFVILQGPESTRSACNFMNIYRKMNFKTAFCTKLSALTIYLNVTNVRGSHHECNRQSTQILHFWKMLDAWLCQQASRKSCSNLTQNLDSWFIRSIVHFEYFVSIAR